MAMSVSGRVNSFFIGDIERHEKPSLKLTANAPKKIGMIGIRFVSFWDGFMAGANSSLNIPWPFVFFDARKAPGKSGIKKNRSWFEL